MKNLFVKIKEKFDNDSFELLNHSKNYLGSKFVMAVLSFLSIPIITRLLPPEQYGSLNIFISFISIFNILFGLSLRGAIKINYIKKDYPHKEYLFSNLIFLLIINLVLFSLVYFLKDVISTIFNFSSYLIIMACLIAIGDVYILIKLSLLQAKKQSRQYSIINVLKQGSILIISLLVIYLITKYSSQTEAYFGQVYTTLLITSLFSIYFIYRLFREARASFHWTYVKDALKFGLPMIPDGLMVFILSFFDQIIINQLVGATKTGIYSLAYRVGMIMQTVVLSMNMAWQPIYWEKIKEKSWDSINSLAKKYSGYVFIVAIGLMLFSKELVIMVADKEYLEAISLVPIIVMSYTFVFLYTLFSGIEFYSKKGWLILVNSSIAAITNIILNYTLIPRYGYQIAAWTTLASYFLLFITHYLTSMYILKFDKLKLGSILKNFIYLLIVFALVLLLSSLGISFWLSLLVKIVVMILSLIIFFKNFFKILIFKKT